MRKKDKLRKARRKAQGPSRAALMPKIPPEFTNHIRHKHFQEIRKANRDQVHKPAE